VVIMRREGDEIDAISDQQRLPMIAAALLANG
jgi:hypothetical protein